jgi:hypothetical protein
MTPGGVCMSGYRFKPNLFAQGQSRRFRDVGCESALPPRTDIVS